MLAQDNAWSTRPKKDKIPSYSFFTQPIERSQQDDREYRLVKLENGLEAMVVHDPKAEVAAASLDVAVGHLSDPADMPGLAHFCEHLLFMGTELFPRENEYSEYLAKNNGSSNAYTSVMNTNYHFQVATPALSQALAHFAAFFHCPLFDASCTMRELNAVDSENKKNLQNDMWRIFQLNKHLSKEGHVWSKFGTGNQQSLTQAARDLKARNKVNGVNGTHVVNGNLSVNGSATLRSPSPSPSTSSATSETEADGGFIGQETRRRLIEWWREEYCAGRMRLCVIGKEPVEELSDLVATLFSPIQNRGKESLPRNDDHPFGSNEKGTLVSVQTIMDLHAVEVSFPMEYQAPLWRHKPANFLAHLVGHEGPGSLTSYLKKQGWLTYLSAGGQNLARGFGMFKVTIHLTQAGFQNYRQVVSAVFKYLSLLRSSELSPRHQSEIAKINSIRFRFQEKRRPEDYAVWVTEHLSWPVPPNLVLSAPPQVWEWDNTGGEKDVRHMLESLKIDQGRVTLMAKKEEHAKLREGENMVWEKEPWYGTEYRVERWDEDFVRQAQRENDIQELYLPGPNKFIPTNLEVEKRDVAEVQKRPHLIRQTDLSTLWYKKDDQFWTPKARLVMELRSPVASASPRDRVMTKLFTELVNDALNEYAYDADLAGLSYMFGSHSLGTTIMISGYNDKLGVLAESVLKKIKTLEIAPDRLEVFKEQIKRDWENFFLGQTYRISDYFGRYLLTQKQWTIEETLKEIPNITVQEIQSHASALLSQLNIQMLVTGNMYKDEAIQMAQMAEDILKAKPIPPNEVIDRALILPEGSNYVWSALVPNPNEPNSSLTYFLHLGKLTDPKERVVGSLLVQILSEPAFNVLRTQEQLGYIVSCSSWNLAGEGQRGIRIIVQSEREPVHLERRVEAFLGGMKSEIEKMAPEVFEEHKSGLRQKWTEAVKNLSEEASRYWTHIDSGYLDFLRRWNDANALTEITKTDVLDLFLSRVHPSSSRRSKLSVHLKSRKPRPPRISVAAAEAFADLVKPAKPTVDADGWRDALGETMTAADFAKYWAGILGDDGKTLLEKIPALMVQHPVIESSVQETLEGQPTYIEDIQAYKSALPISEEPAPLVEWNDLPIAKF